MACAASAAVSSVAPASAGAFVVERASIKDGFRPTSILSHSPAIIWSSPIFVALYVLPSSVSYHKSPASVAVGIPD